MSNAHDKVQTGSALAVAMLGTLGISPKNVLDVELITQPARIAALRVTFAVPDNVTGKLCTILEEYELVRKERPEHV